MKSVRSGMAVVRYVAAMGVTFFALGCGGGANGGRAVIEHSFPSKEKVGALGAAPPPSTEKLAEGIGLAVNSWKLAGPFPDAPASTPYTGTEPLVRAVGKQLQTSKRPFVLTESMQCFAREMGRFFTVHRKFPQLDLQAFMAGRCGVVPNSPSVFYVTSAGQPSIDAAVKIIDKDLQGVTGAQELGVWMGGSDKGQVVMAVYGAPKVKLGAVNVVREGQANLRIQGRLLESTGWLRGYTSIGALGSSTCVPTPRSAAVLPDFDLQCALGSGDAYAVFDLLAGPPQSVLGHEVLSLVLPVKGEPPSSYTSLVVSGAPGAKEGLLTQINAVRSSMKRASLQEVPAQSHTAGVLVPHFFAASFDHEQSKLDLITLGLMAGWDVPGPIRDAHLVSFRGTRGDNAPSFLSELLFFPSTRSTLLDPDARRVAVATMQDGKSQAVLGLVTTYSIFEPKNHAATETDLLDELDRQRQARGKKSVERVGGEEVDRVFEPIMAKLTRGEMTPTGAMHEVLEMYAQKLHRTFQGTVYPTMVIDGWRPTFEGPLVELDGVAVTSKVGFFVGEGANWGQYVTYFIYMPL